MAKSASNSASPQRNAEGISGIVIALSSGLPLYVGLQEANTASTSPWHNGWVKLAAALWILALIIVAFAWGRHLLRAIAMRWRKWRPKQKASMRKEPVTTTPASEQAPYRSVVGSTARLAKEYSPETPTAPTSSQGKPPEAAPTHRNAPPEHGGGTLRLPPVDPAKTAASPTEQIADEIERETGRTRYTFRGEKAWRLVADPEYYEKRAKLVEFLEDGNRRLQMFEDMGASLNVGAMGAHLDSEQSQSYLQEQSVAQATLYPWINGLDAYVRETYGIETAGLMRTHQIAETPPQSLSLAGKGQWRETKRRLDWLRSKLNDQVT